MVVCAECGKEFDKDAYWAGYNKRKGKHNFCSKHCSGVFGRRIQIDKIKEEYGHNIPKCKNCGKDISFEKRKNMFCSQSCAATYNNIRKPSRVPIHMCLNCHKNFTCSASSNGKYCCLKCFFESRAFVKKWLDGEISGTTLTGLRGGYIKKYLIELYNNKCQLCGWGELNQYTNTIPLDIHHIDGNYKNNRPENLQLLCPNCHALTPTYKAANKGNGRKLRKETAEVV